MGTDVTEMLCLTDSYLQEFTATVMEIDGAADDRAADDRAAEGGAAVSGSKAQARVRLDRTAFYPTGGGQPHDTGTLADLPVLDVRKEGDLVWHLVDGTPPVVGSQVVGRLDWARRHRLMRTHTAMHVLCGVIDRRWGVAVTGGNMDELSARMDFEFDPLPPGFAEEVERLVNEELRADRAIEVSLLPSAAAQADPALIRTKMNLIPAHVKSVRVVDIVGLDRQADGGTHVRSTSEVGGLRVVKTESKGKGNKRIRIEVVSQPD